MRLSILVLLLTLFPASALAQPADTTAAPVTQAADTTGGAVQAPPDTAAVVPPPATPPPPAATPPPSESDKKRRLKVGAGVHYMETVGDIQDADAFDSSALNALVAVKFGLGLISIEGDSEWAFDFGGSDHTLWMPQLFALVGRRLLYGGVGIGAGYFDGEWFDQPVYTLRAGVNIPLGIVVVDVNANYQFMSSDSLEGFGSEDLDSVTFGALVWF